MESLADVVGGPSTMSSECSASFEEHSTELAPLEDRDVRTFRLKQLCGRPCNCRQFCHHSRIRILSGKAVYLVLLIIFFERLAFYGALTNVLPPFLGDTSLSKAEQALVLAIAENIIAQFLYPLAGWLADVWLGRYRTIHVSLWVLWIGYSLIAIAFSFGENLSFFLPIGFLITSFGTAGFQANVIPFGADQIVYRASEELSSYFYWYYWVRNIGAIVYTTTITCTNLSIDLEVTIFAAAAAASITVALSLNAIFKDWLFIDPERMNPMKTVVNVVYSTAKAKRPRERSAFSFNAAPPPRIDLTKQRHGGKFTNEEVEDVKTFLRLVLVLVATGSAFMVYTGMISIAILQSEHMTGDFLRFSITSTCTLESAQWGTNILTIIIAIPILNQVVYPCLREYTPNMLKRIGIGYFLALISPFIMVLIEGLGHHMNKQCMFVNHDVSMETSVWLILIPQTTINLAEVFIAVSSLEFFYAQSPHNMRGLMIGLFFFAKGVFSSLVAVILFIFSQADPATQFSSAGRVDCGFWYYFILFLLALFGFLFYILVSRWYKRRQRGELEESERFYINRDSYSVSQANL